MTDQAPDELGPDFDAYMKPWEDQWKQKRIDAASEHPYECKCEICKEWWEAMGPEE